MEKAETGMKRLVYFSFIFIRGNVLREGKAQLCGQQVRGAAPCTQQPLPLNPLGETA